MAIRNTATRIVVNLVTFIALEAFCLVLINNTSAAHNFFFSKWATSISGAAYRVVYGVSSFFELSSVNEELNEQNFRLYKALAAQNSDPDYFSPSGEHSFELQKAMIIGAKFGSGHNYFILNKGLRDGVSRGCGVVTTDGVIGVIQAVSANVSYVASFQNFEMSVSARLGKDGITGPMVWDGKSSNIARMHNIPIHYVASLGDTVYTSGYSTIFPGSIPLGTVVSTQEERGTSTTLKISLFEDFRALKYVYICKSAYFDEIKLLVDAHEK